MAVSLRALAVAFVERLAGYGNDVGTVDAIFEELGVAAVLARFEAQSPLPTGFGCGSSAFS